MAADFYNMTEYPALCFPHYNLLGEYRNVVILGVSFEIGNDGELIPLAEQPPLNFAERTYGDPMTSALVRESDLAPEKPYVDLIVNAHAYAQNDIPARRFEAGLAIRAPSTKEGVSGPLIRHSILVATGPRQWRRRSLPGRMTRRLLSLLTLGLISHNPWSLTSPKAVRSVPIRYDYAYGGTMQFDEASTPDGNEPLQCLHADNPFGRGYVSTPANLKRLTGNSSARAKKLLKRWRKTHRVFDAPQIEWPKHPLPSDPTQPYPLAGWGTVSKHAKLRLKYTGTFDQRWREERHPLLPEDFNTRYWNGAHPTLQFETLPSDAHIELHRVIPASRRSDQILRIKLPGLRFIAKYQDHTMTDTAVSPMRMDTVHIDVENNTLTLLYRNNLPPLAQPNCIELSQEQR